MNATIDRYFYGYGTSTDIEQCGFEIARAKTCVCICLRTSHEVVSVVRERVEFGWKHASLYRGQ
jgi:hypothetical protein